MQENRDRVLDKTCKLCLSILCIVLFQANVIAEEAADTQKLLSNFWSATSSEEIKRSQEKLIEAVPDIGSLYELVHAGPEFSADVPLGQSESARYTEEGIRFPYVILVPEGYDPTISYPVDFMLHGGVSRPEWEPGGAWWRRGYDSLKQDDRIMVVPASWDEAFWWFDNQADSLPEILKSIKQTYNVDDNRVTLTGVSDGGTGTYFFAFKQPTEWAVFLPYIGHPGVLRNPQGGGGHRLYFENLKDKPLYIVNGENDPLYPVSSLQPFIDILEEVETNYVFTPIAGGGHNTNWLPDETEKIEAFKLDNPRDPFPESIRWVADRTDRYNRNLWIQIDELQGGSQPGILDVNRDGNVFNVVSEMVTKFRILLNPEEVDFSQAIQVNVNGSSLFNQVVVENPETLFGWMRKDMDKAMLYTAELILEP